MLAPLDASRNRTLPGWQRWMLAPSDASRNRCLQVEGMDARPIGCFYETDVNRLAGMDTGRDGCSPHRMLLETGR